MAIKSEDVRNKFIDEILKERKRQIEKERFSSTYDDRWKNGELAMASAFYALPDETRTSDIWPFSDEMCKPTPDNRKRELVKAGALLLAEMERLCR